MIVVQSAAILLQPLVQLFLYFSKGGQGLVLFMRHCFFILSILASYVSFNYQRKYLPLIPALLGAFLILSFWPFSIPSMSYNTMGMLFLLIGEILIFEQIYKSRATSFLPLGVTFLLLAAFCYPTFAIPTLLLFILIASRFKKIEISKMLLISCGVILVTFGSALIYLVFFYTSPGRLKVIFDFVKTYGVHGTWTSKLVMIGDQLAHNWKFIVLQVSFLLFPAVLFKYSQKLAFIISVGLAILLFWYPSAGIGLPPFHITILSLSIVGVVLALIRQELVVIAFIGFVSGGISAWTSSNGLTNFAIGGLVGGVAYAVLFYKSLHNWKIIWARAVYFVVIGSIITFQLRSLGRSVYGDDSTLVNLTQRVENGAFWGLRTTPEKRDFLHQISTDIANFSHDNATIAFFDFFAGGPLISDLKISTPMIWTNSLSQFPQDRSLLARFYEVPNSQPDILVWFDSIPVASYFNYDLHHNQQDDLRDFLIVSYEKKITRKEYSIYIRNRK
ncbi:MAG: hypothetical protein ACXWRA_09685 [Pseudobdellovibrionaceae bacterium]